MRDELLFGEGFIVEISPGQSHPTDDDLARHADGNKLKVFVHDQYFHIRHGAADRHVLADLVAGRHLKGSRHYGSFRRAIYIDILQPGAVFLDVFADGRFAGRDQHAHISQGFLIQYCQIGRGHVGNGDVVPVHQLQEGAR